MALIGAKQVAIGFLFCFLVTLESAASQQQQQAPVVNININQPPKQTKILIPNLHPKHYQFWLKNHPLAFQEYQQSLCTKIQELSSPQVNLEQFKQAHLNLSIEDERYFQDLNYGKRTLGEICSKIDSVSKSCWGYENSCQIIYLMPECYGSHLGQASSEQEQKVTWFNQGDFGYILNRRKEMAKFCSPDIHSNHSIVSSLECSKSFKTCRGDNLLIKFLPDKELTPLQVGGWNCDLQKKRIEEEFKLRQTPIHDWFDMLRNYDLILGSTPQDSCEMTIEKPVFFIKMNSSDNMYKYISNFVNLYATIHLNNRFTDDNQIIIWDSGSSPRRSKFDLWRAFSRNLPMTIGQFEGKSVCFKKFTTVLLSKQQDRFFYEQPLISGCTKTGLFDAFTKHILHKFNVPQVFSKRFESDTLKIIILSRSPTHRLHRRIVNEHNLKQKLQSELDNKLFSIELIDPDRTSFPHMMTLAQQADILIGIHSTSLTYGLFLPDWGALFEVFDCNDNTYHDLARLRGLSYFRITDENKFIKKLPVDNFDEYKRLKDARLAEHDKFSNYNIDEDEFATIVKKAIEQVKKNWLKYSYEEMQQPTKQPTPLPQGPPPTTYTYRDEVDVPHTTKPNHPEVTTTTVPTTTKEREEL